MTRLIRSAHGKRENLEELFIENQNSDLKFAFQLDNENENQKKIQVQLNFKNKIAFPFQPRDSNLFRQTSMFSYCESRKTI